MTPLNPLHTLPVITVEPSNEPSVDQPSTPMSSALSNLTPDFNAISEAPEWFLQRARLAWEDFQAEPLPGRRDEHWRYSNAKLLELENLRLAAEPAEAEKQKAISLSVGLKATAARLIFLNDRLIHSDLSALPQGVVCLPFAEALRSEGDVLQEYLMKRKAELGSSKFAALHLAHLRAGVVILVPKNAVIEQPIEVFHWVSGEHAVTFPHTLVVTGEHSKVTVVDHHTSLQDEPAQSMAVADLVAGHGSKITYINCQEMSRRARALHISSTTVGREAEVKALQLQLGASFTRSESVSDLIGEGGRSEMLAVSLPGDDQLVDQRTLQHHLAPHTYSNLLYKNSLHGKGRSIFAGLINVAVGAHYTDAYQKCRNLLNSDESEAISMPGLEINADQVKCSHGATSAPISADEIFYLQARGIPAEDSRRLIALGFLEDVMSQLDNPALADMLNERLEAKFAGLV
jgi:Fe-S cluster assembly protein SufD